MSDRVTRSVDFTAVRNDGDGLTLEGYAAVFNTRTDINSWEGKFAEVVAPGAFRKTLSERGDKVVLQFDHGQHPMIGSMPIGRIEEMREDARGLYVKARLFDNDLIRPVRDAISGGAIKGMSFQFSVTRDEWDDTDPSSPVRTIREVKLYELGPVVFPAYEQTTVGVRAREVARDLAVDPDFRDQVVRALIAAGTTEDADVDDVTSDVAALDDAPPAEGTRRDRTADADRLRELINKHRSAS